MMIINSSAQGTTKFLDPELRKVFTGSVVQLLREDSDTVSSGSPSLAYRCSRLAALILIDAIMRERFDYHPNNGRFIHNLRMSLLDVNTLWGQSMEMFAIVMSKTDRIALERPWRAWYAVDLIITVININDETWTIVEQTLLKYIRKRTLDAILPPQLSAIWDLQNIMAILSFQLT